MFFANHRILSAVFKTAVLGSAAECIVRLFDCSKFRHIIFSALIFVSPYLFGDVISWNSAFCNYIPPVVLLLLLLNLLKNYDVELQKGKKIIYYFLCIVISFCSQLFIEHMAVVNIFIFAVLTMYYFKNKDKKRLFSFTALNFLCAGIFIVAFLPKMLPAEDLLVVSYGEQLMGQLNLKNLIYHAAGVFSLAAKEISFDIAVFGFLSVCIIIALKKSEINKKVKILLMLLQAVYPLLIIFSLVFNDSDAFPDKFELLINSIRLLICAVYIFSIFVSLMLLIKDKKTRQIIILIFLSAVVSLPPASLSGKAFYRAIYFVHIAVVLAGVIFAKVLVKEYNFNFNRFENIFSAVSVCLAAVLIAVYANQYNIYLEKEKSVSAQIENKSEVIYVPKLDEVLFYFPNSLSEMDERYGKYSFDYMDGLPEYKFMSYKEWKEFMNGRE